MSAKGLIIAIEQYTFSKELAQRITGAAQAGRAFFDWLRASKNVAPKDVYACVDADGYPTEVRRFSTARESIVDALATIVNDGQDQTEELFVFYSGHGFSFKDSTDQRALDVLVAADFVSVSESGTKCIRLPDLQAKLFSILGGQSHYYFLDACRTRLNSDDVEPIPLGRKLGRIAQRGTPSTYTLFSTASGRAANIESEFTPALLDGLRGKGQAKDYTPDGRLFVQFPRLKSYVQSRLKSQQVDEQKDGNGEGRILEIAPIPQYHCKVTVYNGTPQDNFVARLAPIQMPQFATQVPFTGNVADIPYPPGNLQLEILQESRKLTRVLPPPAAPLDFFDDCTAEFVIPLPSIFQSVDIGEEVGTHQSANVRFDAPLGTTVNATHLTTGRSVTIQAGSTEALAPGEYKFDVLERGATIRSSVNMVTMGADVSIDLAPDDPGPVRRSIIQAVHGDPARGSVDFSETLGPMTDRDLGLWLTIMGASHIMAVPDIFSKLKDLPLIPVETMTPGQSRLYVMAALQEYRGIDMAWNGQWISADPVPTLQGVFHHAFDANAGSGTISVQVDRTPVRTYSSFALANRVTLFVVAEDDQGRVSVNQLMLPAHNLVAWLHPNIRVMISRDAYPLRTVRAFYEFQRKFVHKQVLAPAAVDQEEQNRWLELLHGKWIDPVMTLLVCYECVRRGHGAIKKLMVSEVIPNLEKYFPDIPDTAAVAELLGLSRLLPISPPLFTEGLLAFPDWEDSLPYPARKLDFGSTWTTWMSAVPR